MEAIKARCDAATAGPWKWESWDDRYESVRNELAGVLSPDGGESRYRAIQVDDADAAFIVAARSDVPALVAEVERLRVEVAALNRAYLLHTGAFRVDL